MDLISSRYRKPKGRPTKRRKMLAENSKKLWQKSSKTVDEKNSNSRGHAALETFSSVLNMPTMDRKTFAKCMHNLSVKNKEVKKKMLEMSRQAAREAHVKVDASLKNQEIIDVSVSYDGTWQKRGHTSNLGLGIIIDILSGLVLDFEVLSKYCHNCVVAGRDMGVDSAEFHIWQKGHADECDKNFDGTSGAMEMHAALIMWRRSISDCQMRFVSMLSDGDSKTFQFLSDNKIYGSDIKIEKEECLNHIAKRLGTSLRNKVKEWKVKKVTLGGRKQGSLTDKNITKLQNYYRKAIKDNVPDTDKMKTATCIASLMHCSSTDKKPMHGKCPEGESSWCFYKRAIAKGETPGSHSSMKTYLSPQVVEKIMPVYQRLASDTILERCVAGKTQNSNESLHSCIWRKCPKEVFVSKRRLEIAVTDAIEKHNLGYVKSLEAKEDSCLNDSFSLTIAERQDKRRISQNISTKQKRKRNATNTNAAYSAGAF
ncbi:uncharacterized protein TNCV_4201061 [Trichonephila clavipes]|uniref:Mutator-like transposase domain-containing protein n=2 Tax=Trichonephila clavipes TaxID=2585209 RepID=A0A8X6WC07_TRICX|nr:uncharacterized protein TNCV_4201061 [Trichonephila clavipes]